MGWARLSLINKGCSPPIFFLFLFFLYSKGSLFINLFLYWSLGPLKGFIQNIGFHQLLSISASFYDGSITVLFFSRAFIGPKHFYLLYRWQKNPFPVQLQLSDSGILYYILNILYRSSFGYLYLAAPPFGFNTWTCYDKGTPYSDILIWRHDFRVRKDTSIHN